MTQTPLAVYTRIVEGCASDTWDDTLLNDLAKLLKRNATTGIPLTAVVAGSGLVTRCAVEAGADLLFVLNAGLYRTLGTGSLASFLPFGNANDQTEQLLREQVMPRSGGIPVVAGVLAGDPTLSTEERLARLRELGVAGVVNWPAVGFIDGTFRDVLEAEGLGLDAEAEMLHMARAQGFSTFGFTLRPDEVERLAFDRRSPGSTSCGGRRNTSLQAGPASSSADRSPTPTT